MLKKALADNVQDTFNMISVDGDTSTNDMVSIMANGMAGNETVTDENSADYATFRGCRNLQNRALSVKEYLFLLEK